MYLTSATSLSGTWTTPPLPRARADGDCGSLQAAAVLRIQATMIGKFRSLPGSYRLPAAWPPMAAWTVLFTSPGARP